MVRCIGGIECPKCGQFGVFKYSPDNWFCENCLSKVTHDDFMRKAVKSIKLPDIKPQSGEAKKW